MISIIIPAHNEESVIARGLRAILTAADPGELEVIVSCNGCTDRTAEIARSFGPAVRVLEIPTPSKIAALNAADAIANGFPRIYVDADVVLDLSSVRAIRHALDAPQCLLAAPRVRMSFNRVSWSVRAFYRVWRALPYNQTMVGTGVYALSARGRERFREFPPVIADDGFVRANFSAAERICVDDAEVEVEPPHTLSDLIRVKTRSRLGQYQLRRMFPKLTTVDPKSVGGTIGFILCRLDLLVAWPTYLFVNAVVRRRARRQLSSISTYQWERDDSSRTSSAD